MHDRSFFRRLGLLAACFGLQAFLSASAAPLKVFILAGQSNMQGHANVSTFDYIGKDPKTAPMLKEMLGPDGKPKVSDEVWISLLNGTRGGDVKKDGKLTAGFGARDECIGPEFTFGLYMNKLLGEPVLLIKTAWGGKSLHTDFRSPSAGPFEFSEVQLKRMKDQGTDVAAAKAAKEKATGHYYREMIAHVNEVLSDPKAVCPAYDPKEGYVLSGFVWFQGWNDMTDSGIYPNRDKPGGYDAYSEALTHFIKDVRKDLDAPKLPFVIGVMGTGGPLDLDNPDRYTPIHNGFRQAMAAPAKHPEFKGTVVNVLTEKCWDPLQEVVEKKKGAIKAEINKLKKEGRKFTRDEEQEFFLEKLSAEEMAAYKGISNQGYHYLGSAKILACIGKEFAEAMAPLVTDR